MIENVICFAEGTTQDTLRYAIGWTLTAADIARLGKCHLDDTPIMAIFAEYKRRLLERAGIEIEINGYDRIGLRAGMVEAGLLRVLKDCAAVSVRSVKVFPFED